MPSKEGLNLRSISTIMWPAMKRLHAHGILLFGSLTVGAFAGMAQTLITTFQFTTGGWIGTPATATTPFQGYTFANVAVSITTVANITNRTSPCASCYYIPNDSAIVSIAGIGTFQFLSTGILASVVVDPVKGVVGESISFVASSPTAQAATYLGPTAVTIGVDGATSWDLGSSFGPIHNSVACQSPGMLTTGGTLELTVSLNIPNATFQATYTGTPPPPTLTRSGVLSHITTGGYWDTKINLINTSSAPVAATVHLYADNGSSWTLPVSITQPGSSQTTTASSVSVTVNPNSTVLIATTSNPSANSVWGWADVQSSGPIGGFAVLRSTPTNDKPSEATVPLQTSFPSSLILPYDNTAGYVMGMALVNLATGSANMSAMVWDDTGNQLGSQPISIAGNGHTAFVLPSQLPVTAGKRGIIQFQNPSGGISGLGLRFSPAGPFTDVPAILP